MARIESQAVAGYYPTPTHLLPALARLVRRTPGMHRDAWCDPCAGKGEALVAMIRGVYPLKGTPDMGKLVVYAAELEESRWRATEKELWALHSSHDMEIHKSHHGDALRVALGTGPEDPGLTGLYLNPPYDHDPRFKRLEERFLRRFLPVLMPGGVCLFVVPAHALLASLDTLGRWAARVEVLRFPDADYGAFKQVVLRCTRNDGVLPQPDPAIVAAVRAAAEAPLSLPVLGEGPDDPWALPTPPDRTDWRRQPVPGAADILWEPRLLDTASVLTLHRAWHQTARNGTLEPPPRVFPRTALGSLYARHPMAVPPKPAHIAAGIAAGVFNGEALAPDDKSTGAPALIVKGRFNRTWRVVEERRDQEGELTGHVEIEEPRLDVTALDLDAQVFCDLKASPHPTGSTDPAKMTTGDLLTQYGANLLRALRSHCPVTHDPADPSHVIPLVQTARPLYAAQAHAAMAVVKLLGGHRPKRVGRRRGPGRARRGKFAFLIGEVGSGKSGTFLVVARSIGAKRSLVMCPPHLLDSWKDEVAVVWPEARTVVLDSLRAVDALADEMRDEIEGRRAGRITGEHEVQPVVAILSREAAKLGHGWTSVARCGRCGHVTPGDHVDRRGTCNGVLLDPKSPRELFSVRVMEVMVGHHPALPGKPRCSPAHAMAYITELAVRSHQWTLALRLGETIASADGRIALLGRIPKPSEDAEEGWGTAAQRFLLAIPPDTGGWESEARRWADADDSARCFRKLKAWARAYHHDADRPDSWCPFGNVRVSEGAVSIEGRVVGTPDALGGVLAGLTAIPSRPCDEPLYAAAPTPARYPLAAYIARRHPQLFDILGLDEAHELSGEGSAQERAAHRLTGTGVPTVLLTGSILNGYAAHLFPHLWALDPAFRERFGREERGKFAKLYGYRRRFVKAEEGGKRKRGKVTDRVEGARDMGEAPGIQPTAILDWLLPHAVTLHKSELDVEIPPLTVERVPIQATEEMLTRHKTMLTDLFDRIRQDRFSKLSGALWGQLTLAPSHLDRMTSDVAGPEGQWVVAYPEERGGGVVHRGECFPPETVLPKEQWMLDELAAEAAADRPVIVLSHHVELMPRYAKLIREKLGLKVAVLNAGKIPPAKRQAWIKAQNAAGVQVLLTNPVAIGTGLNVLVYFATQLWMENPGCNAIVYRQAVGRIDRIGQKRPTRVKFPVYVGTIQEAAHKLLLQKVAVSQSTDGLDARSALQAAGVGEAPDVSALSMGKLLFDLLDKSHALRTAIHRQPRAVAAR